MGCDFDYFVTDKENVKEEFVNYCRNAAYESGNSYTGRLNMTSGLTIERKVFDSLDDAEQYVSDNAKKWEDAIAVQFKEYKIQPSKKMLNIREKIQLLQNEVLNIKNSARKDAESKIKAKAFVTCSGCKSKINTTHLYHVDCPVCRQSLISATDEKRSLKKIQTAKNKVNKLVDQFDAEKAKLESKVKPKIVWFVGGHCSC